jgi:hypothetical protein
MKAKNEKTKKPPIGLKPRWLHDEQRAADIRDAVRRYAAAGKDIPQECLDEHNELTVKKLIVDIDNENDELE